jgi:hypothetical protein
VPKSALWDAGGCATGCDRLLPRDWRATKNGRG